jgi:hypothetical protein
MLIAESLLDDGDLDLTNQYPDRHPFLPVYEFRGHTLSTPGNGLFPIHDIGLPILMLPMLAVAHGVVPRLPVSLLQAAHMLPTTATIALLSYEAMAVAALLTLLIGLYLESYGFTPGQSFWGALLASLTLPIVCFGYLSFTEIYSATFLVGALCLLQRSPSPHRTALYCLILLFLPWLHSRQILSCGFLALFWTLANWKRSRGSVVSVWVSVSASLAIKALVIHHSTHHWTLSAISLYHFDILGAPFSLRYIPRNFLAMLIDRQVGILWSNPLFLLVPIGLYRLCRKRSEWIQREGVLISAYCLLIFSFWDWGAGWAPPSRYLLPIIPLLWLPVLEGGHEFMNRGKAILPAMLLTGALALSFFHWNQPKLFWMSSTGINPWMKAITPAGQDWQDHLPHFERWDRPKTDQAG